MSEGVHVELTGGSLTPDGSTMLDKENKPPWGRPKAKESVGPNSLGCVSEIMILDHQCGVLVSKRSLQNIEFRKAQQLFAKHMRLGGPKVVNPYFRVEAVDFFYINKNDIFIVAVQPSPQTDAPIDVVIYLDFVQRVYEVLKNCIGAVNEAYITLNRMLVFEILDEMLTFGYSLPSTFSEVKPFLTLEPIRPKIIQPDDLASRFFGVSIGDKSRSHSHASDPKLKTKNAVYINIVEGLSAVLGPQSEVCKAELWGKLNLISTLEKPSPIIIELNPDLIVRNQPSAEAQAAGVTHIETPNFHSCVDVSLLSKNKVLRVLPPPDQTRLMVYTLSCTSCIHIPIDLLPSLSDIEGSKDKNLMLRLINNTESHASAKVKVKVKLPEKVLNAFTTKSGDQQTSEYKREDNTVTWEVKKLSGKSEEVISCRLTTQPNVTLQLEDVGPITMAFNLTNFTASGLLVRMARLENQRNSDTSSTPQFFFGRSTKTTSYTVRTDQQGNSNS